MTIELIIIMIMATFFLLSSIRIPAESERIVIFRLGRFFRIVGSGLVLLIPVVDKGIRVTLSEKIPGWQELSKEELELDNELFLQPVLRSPASIAIYCGLS